MAPCVTAAASAFAARGGRAAAVEIGELKDAAADVLVGSGPELTRALESGVARDDSDVAIAEVPWVLLVAEGAPLVGSIEQAVEAGATVDVPAGPVGVEARRFLRARSSRVREGRDLAALRAAPLALVPLSVAGPGRRVAVDVPALVAQAAVGTSAPSADAARAFVEFLGTAEGRRAFASCGNPTVG
jgi:hypothetical protein